MQFEHKISLARAFEAEGRPLHAIQIYQSILEEYPDEIETYIRIANLYEMTGNALPAIKLLRQFLEDKPENKDMRLFLGQLLLRNSKWEEAVEALSFILPQEEPVVSFFTGYANFMLEEYELAKISFLNFISIEKQSELVHEAYIYLAKIELKLKNYEEVLKFARKAEAMYSNFWELNKIYAETYYSLGMYAHAVQPVEKAIKLNPENPASYELAGKIYLKLGDYTKTEKNFLRYIESIEDASSDIYTKLAEACMKNNKAKDALAYYDIAIKLDPKNNAAIAGKNNASSIIDSSVASDV